jgi:hypothetical protein
VFFLSICFTKNTKAAFSYVNTQYPGYGTIAAMPRLKSCPWVSSFTHDDPPSHRG